MRRTMILLIVMGLVAGLFSCIEPQRRPYYDDSYGPYDRAEQYDIAKRIDNQQRRIDQGISAGELTRREADLLMDNLNWIRDEYSRARRDGRLSQSEIERLSEYLNQNNRMIRDKKNNEIRRVYTAPPPFVPDRGPRHEPVGNDFRDRIDNQQRRIDQGFARGDLTRAEVEVLENNLKIIWDKYVRMKASEGLSQGETEQLKQDLDFNSQMIQDKRNNKIRRLY